MAEPTSSGYVSAFVFSARRTATPESTEARAQAEPSAWSGLTSVTSTPKGTPRNSGRPVATISRARPSWKETPGTDMFRSCTFSCTRAPASRKIRAQMRSSGRARRRTRPDRMHETQ